MEEQRCSGRTTRIINDSVEQLFATGSVLIKDHDDDNGASSFNANKAVMEVFVCRINTEHPNAKLDISRIGDAFRVNLIRG